MTKGRPSRPIIAGEKYNMLTAVRANGQDRHGRFTWECLCDCGKTATVKATYLRTGEKKSCGCQQFAGNRRVHGHAAKQSQAYQCWKNMKQRCDVPSTVNYNDYGGRGIAYDPRWAEFVNFLADMGDPPPHTSLDRINNNGNYEKANCRWTDRVTQRVNSRGVLRMVEIKGERMHLAEAVRRFSSVGYDVVLSRILRGWSNERAITEPKQSDWKRR